MKRSQSLNKSLDDVKYEQYVNNLHGRLPQLIDPNDIDCQRWPWELLQNAKDTVVKRKNPEERYVDVTFRYYTDNEGKKKLEFEHNGDQFTNKAITGLIWKFSAEKRNEQTTEDGLTRDKQSTGRFGTGFMTTHALSLTVDVSGSLFHDDPDVMRNVSVDFTLHREGPDDEAYKKGVDKTEREIDENMDKKHIPVGDILPTRFTYHLNREASEKAAKMGLNNVKANATQTMLFCPSVRSITVINEEDSFEFSITRKNNDERKNVVKETTFIEKCSNSSNHILRRFISFEIEEYSEEISSHWKTKDRHLRLHVAIEVDKDNNILPIPATSPSVYCSLPLIGFENMTLPFYINSNDFEPTAERTSLYLKKKRFEYHSNEDTGEEEKYYLQSGINWAIFERSLPLYEKIVDYLVAQNYNSRYNLINGLDKIFKGAWDSETKNCLASRFILPLRNMLAKKNLVMTVDGYRSIESKVKFVECAKEYDLHSLYEICETIYRNDLAIEEENGEWVSFKWSRFNFDDNFEEKKHDQENPVFPIIKYEKVADFIEDAVTLNELRLPKNENYDDLVKAKKLAWLNKFYEWIANYKITNLSNKKIVPNRLGEFCSTEQGCDLKDASEIPIAVFEFMKQIGLDWDKHLLMDGVQHITLAKETKDNIITAIKNCAKVIRDNTTYNNDDKLAKLLPILLALPTNGNGGIEEFLKKRLQIVSILKIIYPNKCEGQNSVLLDLKAETWDETDKWFMNLVASTLADRKHLDVIKEDDTEEDRKAKFCTPEWLSNTLNFMFQKSYLHQEDITEDKNDFLALFPNRYGDFRPINKLYTQDQIPEELLDDKLKKTGYDIKAELLYDGFTLNDKVSISDLTITSLANIYNKFFDSETSDEDKLAIAKFLIHLIPECGDQYEDTREIYDIFAKTKDEDKVTTIIATSDLNIWKGANEYLIKYLCYKASELKNIYKIGETISMSNEDTSKEGKDQYANYGLNWLNRLVSIQRTYKVELNNTIRLIPNWSGDLHSANELTYDGTILNKYKRSDSLINLVNSDLWAIFPNEEKQEEDQNITSSIVHPIYKYVTEFQKNTDEKLFGLVDRIVSFCSEQNSPEWRQLLKRSIKDLLAFFEENESNSYSPFAHKEDKNLTKLFPNTYKNRKNLSYDFIYDAETKARISIMNENYSSDEIEILIENKEFVKQILQNSDISYIQKIIEEFPCTDFKSILNILRREQGDYSTESFQQSISDERKREIGDKGECYVYEILCKYFDSSKIKWSNFAPNDYNARLVKFNGKTYRLTTTSHDFDFIVFHNGKRIYLEVKTTVGNIKNSKDFPLIFETKEWEWIDQNQNTGDSHYIVRVFDIEGSPKVYFLSIKTALSNE